MCRPPLPLLLLVYLVFPPPIFASNHEALKRVTDLGAEVWRLTWDGQYTLGVSKGREALALAEAAFPRNDIRLADPLFNLAWLYHQSGKYRDARPLYERAIKIIEADRGSEHPDLGSTLDRYGGLLVAMGDYPAAKLALERSYRILEKTRHPNDPLIATGLQFLAGYQIAVGDYAAAKPLVERGLKIRQSQRNPSFYAIARSLNTLADIHYKLGEYMGARARYQEALGIRERFLGFDHPDVARNLNGLASSYIATGDVAAAKPLYERGLATARKTATPQFQYRAALGLAQIHEREKRLADAVKFYRDAISLLDDLAGQFEEESTRAQFLQAGNKLEIYDALVKLLLKLHEQDGSKGYDIEAWAVIEAKKGRYVAEVMTASRPQLQDREAREELQKANDMQGQTLALQKALLEEQARPPAAQAAERVKNLTTLLAQTKADYLKQVQGFLTRYPQYRTQFVDQQSVDPKALAKFADRLPEGTVAVQFFPSPDALYLFVVAPGGRFQVKHQALSQSDLYKLIKEYRQYLDRAATQRLPWTDDGSEAYRRDVVPFKELTKKLGSHLLGPIEAELKAHDKLVLIPNDLLLYMPIHALTYEQSDGSTRLLAETHVISYLTQLELADLVNPTKPTPNAPLLALANPDGTLPAASREIREIRKIRSVITTLDGAQATKERFLTLAGNFPDLHLATHGVLDGKHPEKSYLLLAGADETSQRLTISEIAGLRLSPHGLAILSACETAVGEQIPGAALITLAAAFSQAGSQSILASLWKVEDTSTRDLMIAFHSGLPKVGRAVALQEAQLAVLKNPATAHPYFWAPFILIGAR